MTGTVDRAGITASGRATARTAAPAPDGTQHLSHSATATASSVEGGLPRLAARMANDGDPGTRWASSHSDNQWLQLELAAPSTVESVELDWEQACAKSFAIDVSVDGTTWTRAATVDQGTCGTDLVRLPDTGPVRFVRMQGLTRATPYGYSLHELRVFGNPV
ncbi:MULTISPECIES: discoidin domain-containing protein [unclassified Knoellia]|uniref:discoidin domain-containing protein n=1 Tax=Knoellia altitudinis TaxID=3404795 RepID=UPI00360AECE6